MSPRPLRTVAALALVGTSLLFVASCGAPEGTTPASGGSAVESSSSGPQTSVRALVVQVADMKKSQGGST